MTNSCPQVVGEKPEVLVEVLTTFPATEFGQDDCGHLRLETLHSICIALKKKGAKEFGSKSRMHFSSRIMGTSCGGTGIGRGGFTICALTTDLKAGSTVIRFNC